MVFMYLCFWPKNTKGHEEITRVQLLLCFLYIYRRYFACFSMISASFVRVTLVKKNCVVDKTP